MAIDVFISYSPADDAARRTLETHLSALQRGRLIRTWAAHQIGPGREWRAVIDKRLDEAHVVLLLISPDFLASDYCYDVEMKRALERHRAGVARVIPIIVRHVDWRGTPIDGLVMLPEQGRPVSSSGWGTIDKAWTNVAIGLRSVVEEMMGSAPSHSPPSGRSFVEARRSYASAPPSQSAPSFVAPSSRASHPSNPSSARLPTRSQPEIAGPVSTYHPSQRSAAWTPAPTMTRSPTTPRQSRLPLLAAFAFAGAGVSIGVWAVTRNTTSSTATQNLSSTGMFAPQLPAPSPSPTPTLKHAPAPVPPRSPAAVAGACCGGSACDSRLQDTRGSSCARLAGHCATCPSLRDNVEGACRVPLEPSQRFLLRLARLDLKGMTPSITQVCVRLGGDPASARMCTAADDASDAHPGELKAETNTRLPVSVADLVETGRGLDIEVEIGGKPSVSVRARILPDPPLLRSALCQGVSYTFNGARVLLYLDDR
ncbi:MAG: TIR domain-containing protein [Byssovorax sp.]